jgi:PIN domain
MLSTFTAFIDSNVFYGARLRSLVLQFAQTGLFRARWSDDVHKEWIAGLLRNRPDLNEEALQTTRRLMNDAVLDCLVTGYEPLISALDLPDVDDRHILAAAIHCHASVIVTFNERDFPAGILGRSGIHAKHPDDFLLDVIAIDEEYCLEAIQEDIAHYKAPPLTVDDYIDSLEAAGVPKTAGFLRGVKIIFG